MIEVHFLSKIVFFSTNLEEKETFKEVVDITFWNFAVLIYMSNLAKVKINLLCGIKNFVNELLHKLSNDSSFRMTENLEILENSQLGRVNFTFLNLPVMTVCGVNFNNSRSTIPV